MTIASRSPDLPRVGPGRWSGGWSYLAVVAPIIFGTTYLLTTEFLPPGRPLLIATMRSLPTGLVLIIGSRLPPPGWRLKFVLLSVLYSSAFFPLLFIAAYRLPGGIASVLNSLTPIIVVILSVPLLGLAIHRQQILAGLMGIAGVALLVLRSTARLDLLGLLAMLSCVTMIGLANILVKRWGRPPGMNVMGLTGWTFLIGGLTLVPFTLLFEGLPASLTARNVGGFVYLVVFSGIIAYALLFWSLQRLSASAITFLGLINPVVAAFLGWVVLDQRLNGWQILGAAIVLVAVVLGQRGPREKRAPLPSQG